MALTTEQLLIAEVVGYEPVTEDEGMQQFKPEVNYDPEYARFKNEVAKPGSIYQNKRGVYRYYWKPSGGNYSREERKDLEEWTFDSVCFTPAGDDVEPDHPDSWLSILGLI